MTESLSVKQRLPRDFSIAYQAILFNEPSFLRVNNSLPQLHFYLLDDDGLVALGHVAFSREESEVTSPFKASFGGFETTADLSSEAFLFFAGEVMRQLKEQTVRFVRIQLPPPCYQPNLHMIEQNLEALGFKEKRARVHHVITVEDSLPLAEKMVVMEQRKLKKAIKAQLVFGFASRNEFAAVFKFIKDHREARGHQLSLDWDALKQSVRNNPGQYLFTTVKLDRKLVAAAILVKTNDQVIYYFLPVHDREFNGLSPMVFLINSLYDWCKENEVAFIDLGTSYLGNRQNDSLVKFKEHMGGKPQTSRVFRKALSLKQNRH